jgi:hypothetical protein
MFLPGSPFEPPRAKTHATNDFIMVAIQISEILNSS